MSTQYVKDELGRPLGKWVENVDGTISVFDDLGRPAGTVKDDGTYDDMNRKISESRMVGLLLGR